MSETKTINTAWMWNADDEVHGVRIDTDKRILEWYDTFGCACAGSFMLQSYEEYQRKGAFLNSIPEDVEQELTQAVAHFSTE